MTLLITGADGQLGRALRELAQTARFTTRRELDITDAQAIGQADWTGVTGIINAAAYTAVDAAEDSPSRAWAVNAHAVGLLAERAQQLDVPLVHVSTDYVFSGDFAAPISPSAPVAPRSVYGASKAAGEYAARRASQHYVVRTSWLYGDGVNFIRTMRRLAAERDSVDVVADQMGRPTHAIDLARAILALLAAGAPGTYHAAGTGEVVSWADVAEAATEGTGCRINRISTADFAAGSGVTRAVRPAYSALEVSPEVDGVMRDWRIALREFVEQEQQ